MAFRQGLKETGYAEGENVAIEYRWADGQADRLPALAADLVRRQVAVIAVPSRSRFGVRGQGGNHDDPDRLLWRAKTRSALGLVASLARPGGNLTGINFFATELTAKRLELLRELVPAASRIAVLASAGTGANTEATLRDVGAAARAMGLQVRILNANNSREIDAAFATFVRERPDALLVTQSPSSSAGVSNWPTWQPAMASPRFMRCATTPMSAG